MSAHYNAHNSRATRRVSGAQYGDPSRTGHEASFVAPGAIGPTSVVPRSPYGYPGDPGSTTHGDASRGLHPQNASAYSAQPGISTSASLYQSLPQSSSLNYAQGNYTLRSSQPVSPAQLGHPSEIPNPYAQYPASHPARDSGYGHPSSLSQPPGIDGITDGIRSLATSPTTTQWSSLPGPVDPGYASELPHVCRSGSPRATVSSKCPIQSVATPSRGSNRPPNVISGTSATNNTSLDPRYVVQKNPKNFFKVGRVFAILWHENEGSTGRGTQSYISEGPVYMGRFNELVHSGIRRMVVVKALDQCAWCFPVSTYSRKGVAKAGVDASKHAVIYMQGTKPQLGSGEPPMRKEPLEVAPASPDQKLDHMSRLNFGKIYTVEHNVKVLPVGKITERSMPRFQSYAVNEFNIMP